MELVQDWRRAAMDRLADPATRRVQQATPLLPRTSPAQNSQRAPHVPPLVAEGHQYAVQWTLDQNLSLVGLGREKRWKWGRQHFDSTADARSSRPTHSVIRRGPRAWFSRTYGLLLARLKPPRHSPSAISGDRSERGENTTRGSGLWKIKYIGGL